MNKVSLLDVAGAVGRASEVIEKEAAHPGESADFARGVRQGRAEILAQLRHAFGEDWERVWAAIEASRPPAPSRPPRSEVCPGFETGGTGPRCCERAGRYNGFGSDGPTLFICPNHCGCHD